MMLPPKFLIQLVKLMPFGAGLMALTMKHRRTLTSLCMRRKKNWMLLDLRWKFSFMCSIDAHHRCSVLYSEPRYIWRC